MVNAGVLDHPVTGRPVVGLVARGGSRKLAAERLGISPRTLRHKLQQFKAAGVTVPRLHNEEFAAV